MRKRFFAVIAALGMLPAASSAQDPSPGSEAAAQAAAERLIAVMRMEEKAEALARGIAGFVEGVSVLEVPRRPVQPHSPCPAHAAAHPGGEADRLHASIAEHRAESQLRAWESSMQRAAEDLRREEAALRQDERRIQEAEAEGKIFEMQSRIRTYILRQARIEAAVRASLTPLDATFAPGPGSERFPFPRQIPLHAVSSHRVFLLPLETRVRENGGIILSLRTEYIEPLEVGGPARASVEIARVLVDCPRSRLRVLSLDWRGMSGERVGLFEMRRSSTARGGGWQSLSGGDPGERLAQSVCTLGTANLPEDRERP